MKSLYYISLASQRWFLGALVRSRLIKCCPLEEGNQTVSSLDRNKLGRSMAMNSRPLATHHAGLDDESGLLRGSFFLNDSYLACFNLVPRVVVTVVPNLVAELVHCLQYFGEAPGLFGPLLLDHNVGDKSRMDSPQCLGK